MIINVVKIMKYFILCLLVQSYTYSNMYQYIATNSIPHEIGQELNTEITNKLDRQTHNKKIVFLGEGDHFFHEKWQYRLSFIKYLHAKGFRYLLHEMGSHDGSQINKYIQSGDEKHLDQVGLYGHNYKDPSTPLEQKGYKPGLIGEEKRFYKAIKQLSDTDIGNPIIHIGYDIDVTPGGAFYEIDKLLSPFSSNIVDKLKELLSDEKIDTAETLLKVNRSKLIKTLGKKVFKSLDNSIYTLARSFEFKKKWMTNFSYEDLEWREQIMFKNFDAITQDIPKNAKIIMMGHNMHVIKSTKGIKTPWGSDYKDYKYAIGQHVTSMFPNQVYAIWSNIAVGEHGGFECSKESFCNYGLNIGSFDFNLFFINDKQSLFFTTEDKIFINKKVNININGIQTFKGHSINNYFDAYYFIPRTTRMIP